MAHMPLPPFSGWAGPRNPKMLIVGEAWGENEHQCRQPFVGSSGLLLWEMLGQAIPDVAPHLHAQAMRAAYRFGNAWIRDRIPWLEESGIAYTNVLNFQPPSNNLDVICCAKKELHPSYDRPALIRGKYLLPEYLPEIDRLLSEIDASQPNCIVAAGNTACWALLRATNIGAIRGTTTSFEANGQAFKVIPAYHPAAILRQWQWKAVTTADLGKAYREAISGPDLIRPSRWIVINPSLRDVETFCASALHTDLLSVDIETKWGMISCIGFATSSRTAMVIPFINHAQEEGHYWPELPDEIYAWNLVKTMLECDVPKLFQNGLYDLQYIVKMGIRPRNVAEDTMLLHHSLYPEMRKGLGFLASIYSNESAWKLMGRPKADTVKRDE